jgi:serine protease Do
MIMQRLVAAALGCVLIVGGCGAAPAASTSATSAATAAATPAPSAPEASAASGALTKFDEAINAVIQIEATGSFRDPEAGEQVGSGRGSGFVIDPSGIAVTNNHVVTGAATIKVWLGPDREEHAARVLGASECADLAVIEIDGVSNVPYLEWYDDDIRPGLDIYVAGFPLGDPEYTLTRGIVSRAHGILDENWAWVEDSIEHDAATNPGNSGGPVVTTDAKVVGVHYAGDPSTQQHWAISSADASQVVERLRQGEDLYSIGVNGSAFTNAEFTGIWVYSVKPGSPAAKAGIVSGDIITRLSAVALASDGTMREYCEVLRSHRATDVMPIQVLRQDTSEVLEGEINGAPLALTTSFAEDEGTNADYPEYVNQTDDTGTISVELPTAWTDISTSTWEHDGADVGVVIVAAPDIDAWRDGWETPGVFFGASTSLPASFTPAEYLALSDFSSDCTDVERDHYEDALYSGEYQVWRGCGPNGNASFLEVVAEPADRSFLMLVQVAAVEDRDFSALDRILDTFQLVAP